jgi:uncharacterized protein YegL
MELILFNSSAHKEHKLIRKMYLDWEKDKKNMVASGGTALYDAIEIAINTYPKNKKYQNDQVEMVVLTDGEDTTGKSVQSVKDLVASPGIRNFHLFVIGVGIEARQVAELTELCAPKHAKFLHAVDVHEISKVFSQVKELIIERMIIHERAIATNVALPSTFATRGLLDALPPTPTIEYRPSPYSPLLPSPPKQYSPGSSPKSKVATHKVFLGNIPSGTPSAAIQHYIESFYELKGKLVLPVTVHPGKGLGAGRMYSILKFQDKHSYAIALKKLNGARFGDVVLEATPKNH